MTFSAVSLTPKRTETTCYMLEDPYEARFEGNFDLVIFCYKVLINLFNKNITDISVSAVVVRMYSMRKDILLNKRAYLL